MNEDLERVVKQLDYLVEQGRDLCPPGAEIGIARYLRQQGIKGATGNSTTCPVANYVAKETGINITIGRTSVSVIGEAGSAGIPVPVSSFISLFDAGVMPELQGVTVI